MKEPDMIHFLRQTIVILILLSVLTGLIYPLAVTGVAQLVFPHQANGCLIEQDSRIVGSELIGQPFSDPKYFWPRPSATVSAADSSVSQPYNAANSSGSNLGPLNPALADNVRKQVQKLQAADPALRKPAPVDLVTASGSGLDPHVSVAAALYQVPRVARTRGLAENKVQELVLQHVEDRQFGVLGEKRVNILRLNIALDRVE
jgi:potassium-transporting ATPase KdpC subunit